MLPAKFVERVLRELGPDEGGALCRALTGEPSVSVRLNAAKGLAAPSGRPIGWSSGGYWLDARPSFTLDPACSICAPLREGRRPSIRRVRGAAGWS